MLNQESGDGSGSNQGTATVDDHDIYLPGYLAYFSLAFKIISTVIGVPMAVWVIITIKTTRSLHKTHNIYVAYLMAMDVMYAIPITLLSGAMTIGYFTGLGDFIGCNVFMFMIYPGGIVYLTFLAMSLDKAIAITFPFKHHEVMKPRVVCGILVAKFLLVFMVHSRYLIDASGFTKVAQFGTCIYAHDIGFLEFMITLAIPVFLTSFITVSLDVFLTIKAYQIRKKIQEESKLSGGHSRDNDKLRALKKKEANIKKNLKPMVTLLVVVMGNAIFGLLLPILLIPVALLNSPKVYESVLSHLIFPNVAYATFLIHPFAYALYFKQIREPMMRLLKGITCPCKCKSAAVAPQPQRNRINWLNPN